MKHWIECLFSDLKNKRNPCFILFKSNSILFENHKWGKNRYITIEKHVAYWYIKWYINWVVYIKLIYKLIYKEHENKSKCGFIKQLYNKIHITNVLVLILFLTHILAMFHFHTPRKLQKTSNFLMFSRGIEVEHLFNMG